MGGATTFACKSQECLWQDWYIFPLACLGAIKIDVHFVAKLFTIGDLQIACGGYMAMALSLIIHSKTIKILTNQAWKM